MATGDKLRHRGRLTKQIIAELIDLFEREDRILLSDVAVSFLDERGEELIRLSLVAGLDSVCNDKTSHGSADWKDAVKAEVRLSSWFVDRLA